MYRFSSASRSTPVAVWLFAVAALVFVMVVVGGLTRLTDSGLSITEWKPVMGVVPPLNAHDWAEAFAKYKATPEYAQVNRGMSLEAFKSIFWWEWTHRLLGRLIGLAFALPLVWFLIRRELPQRLVWRCAVLLALGALQGLVGWWMVTSGLEARPDVAPERLAIHLGLALILFAALVWIALEALGGLERNRPPRGWALAAGALLGLAWVQCLLGALVAGNDAGLIYTDWPLFNGKAFPPSPWAQGVFRALLHDQGLVQFDHRLGAYVLLASATTFAVLAVRARMPETVKLAAGVVAGVVWLQALLGIATLMNAVPIWLGALHQAGAVVVLAAATFLLWRVLRSEERLFSGGIGSRGL
jgi:cytochrome c oxidase assembly protein subunit 15